MRLINEIEGVVGDFIPDIEERRGIANNIYYYCHRHRKAVFASGVLVGFFAAVILLKWLA